MTASHRSFTAVYAGAYNRDQARGAFFVFRQMYTPARQKLDVVHVPKAGAVRITRAPLGPKVERTSQEHGVLWFKSRNHFHGKLCLCDDGLTITRSPG